MNDYSLGWGIGWGAWILALTVIFVYFFFLYRKRRS